MARLIAPNGVTVTVSDEKAERLKGDGYRAAAAASDTGYKGQKVADLRAEIAKRNEGRDEAELLSDEGNKADLIATLEADDNK